MNFLQTIDNLSILMKYFIPGAVFIKIFSFIHVNEKTEYEYFIFKSIIISGIVVYPLQLIWHDKDDFTLFVCSILICIIASYCAAMICNSNWAQSILEKMRIRKTLRPFWMDVIDLNKGSYVEVKLKDCADKYTGSVDCVEDKIEGNVFISLENIIRITPDGNEIELNKGKLVFNTENVEFLFFTSAKK